MYQRPGDPSEGQAGTDSSHIPPAAPRVLVLLPPPWEAGDRMGSVAAGLRIAEAVNWDPFHLTGEKSERATGSPLSVKPASSLICLLSLELSPSHRAPRGEEANEPSHPPCGLEIRATATGLARAP